VVPKGMNHVVIGHAMLACRRLDVHEPNLSTRDKDVNIR
jgi:hypothetical protein